MVIVMDNATAAVGHTPDGGRLLQITDAKSGIVVQVPLPAEAARSIGAALSTSLIVAGAALPANGGQNVK